VQCFTLRETSLKDIASHTSGRVLGAASGFPSFLLLFNKDGKRNNGLDKSVLRSNAMTLTEITFSIMTVVGVAVLTWVVRFLCFSTIVQEACEFLFLSSKVLTHSQLVSVVAIPALQHPSWQHKSFGWNIRTCTNRYALTWDLYYDAKEVQLKGICFLGTWPASPQRQLVIADPICN